MGIKHIALLMETHLLYLISSLTTLSRQNAYCNVRYMTLACCYAYILTKYSMCT